MSERKLWLQHFEGTDRARAGRLFYASVRDGADDARKVCSGLFLKLGRLLRGETITPDDRRLFELVRQWMNEDRTGALILAQYCLDFQAAAPEQRARMVEKKR